MLDAVDDRLDEGRGLAGAGAGQHEERAALVVDDVVTTGSTLGRAATALRRAGASHVFGLSIARGVLKTTT